MKKMNYVAITMLFLVLSCSINPSTAFASEDVKLELKVGEQKELKTESDSQIHISRKGIINTIQKEKGTLLITGLKPGFAILNPHPISNKGNRFLIRVYQPKFRKKSVQPLNENEILDFAPPSSHKEKATEIQCFSPKNSRIFSRLAKEQKTIEKLLICSEAPVVFTINISSISKNSSKEMKLNGLSNPLNGQYRDRHLDGKNEQIFLFYFYPLPEPYFSVSSMNGTKVNLKVNWIKQNDVQINSNLELSIKGKNLTFHMKISRIFKYNEMVKWDLIKNDNSLSKTKATWSLSEIPILGILFKGFSEKDETAEHSISLMVAKIE